MASVVRPGANTLRGDKKSFGAKTLNSNWVEDRKDPGFPGVRAHTETDEDRIDYSNVVSYDKSAAPSEWKSVTAATYVTPGEEGIKEVGSRTERRTPCAAQHLPCARDGGTLLYICGIIFLPPAVGVKCTPA